MDEKIYIRCKNCAYWREVVLKFTESYRKGFCTFWKNFDEYTYLDDYCSKGVGKRK